MKKIWNKFKSFLKWIWTQLKDVQTLIIFIIVLAVMYFPAYGFYILSLILNNAMLAYIATVYVAFWAGPFTPFFPLCISITLGIKALINKAKEKKNKTKSDKNDDNDVKD